ncbi:MAG: hypothetical protein RUMPE_00581 [Eubacteriales bacterium SKADARSKE-1]|nr:hypothetical protein [Eubacteriales bacterium SKADARSKE-1]
MAKIKKLSMEEIKNISGGAKVVRSEHGYEVWSNEKDYLYFTFVSKKRAKLCASLFSRWEEQLGPDFRSLFPLLIR